MNWPSFFTRTSRKAAPEPPEPRPVSDAPFLDGYSDLTPAEERSRKVDQLDSNWERAKALTRRFARLVQVDHDKLDRVSRDEVYDEMGRDPVIKGAVRRLDTGISRGVMKVEEAPIAGGDAHRRYTEEVYDQGSRALQTLKAIEIESYCRGLAVGETTDAFMTEGEFQGMVRPDRYRFLKRPSYRLQEDGYGRPHQLEITVQTGGFAPPPGQSILSGSTIQHTQVVLDRWNTPNQWARYQFATYPLESSRAEGDGAFVTIWSHWFFRQYVWQWVRVLCERHGTPAIFAELDAPVASAMIGAGQFPTQADKVLEKLELMATENRGAFPAGWRGTVLSTGAEGLARMLAEVLQRNADEIEVGIVLQKVGSGSEGGATIGGNAAILDTTFGGLVVERQQSLAGRIERELRRYLPLNFGEIERYPRVSFENPNKEREAVEHQAAVSMPFNHVDYVNILSDYAAGTVGKVATEKALRRVLPTADEEEINELIAELDGEREQQAPEDIAEKSVELTPTDLATITSVNEGRASAGLSPLRMPDGQPDPDGDLTIAEFRAKREQKAQQTGQAAGQREAEEVEAFSEEAKVTKADRATAKALNGAANQETAADPRKVTPAEVASVRQQVLEDVAAGKPVVYQTDTFRTDDSGQRRTVSPSMETMIRNQVVNDLQDAGILQRKDGREVRSEDGLSYEQVPAEDAREAALRALGREDEVAVLRDEAVQKQRELVERIRRQKEGGDEVYLGRGTDVDDKLAQEEAKLHEIEGEAKAKAAKPEREGSKKKKPSRRQGDASGGGVNVDAHDRAGAKNVDAHKRRKPRS